MFSSKTRVMHYLMTILTLFLTVSTISMPGGSPKTESEIYNQGVDLMKELKFKRAEKKFRKAIEKDEEFAEAHNNLAYCLRKQGEKNYDEAMKHYNKAIALKPKAPEPYMYRGVLFVQMGNTRQALNDHKKLLDLKANDLAKELKNVITNKKEKTPEQFFGVFGKVEE